MARYPEGLQRLPKKGRCKSCSTLIIEKNGRLRKTCSDECLQKSRPPKFMDTSISQKLDIIKSERKESLATDYFPRHL